MNNNMVGFSKILSYNSNKEDTLINSLFINNVNLTRFCKLQ